MRPSYLGLLAAVMLCASGCTTYRYRVVQPTAGAPAVTSQPVRVHFEPLDYDLYRYHDRLVMHVTNPTSDRVALLGNRSFVVDPQGESHPIRDRVLGPHSFTQFVLPPIPFTYAYPDYWAYGPAWGWGWGWYDPFWGPWYGPGWWGPPPVSYVHVYTPYDWKWKNGIARLKLTYDRAGKVFEHDFEIVREPDKR